MIEFDRVSRRFGDLDALRNLNLTIEQGEMAFLTGHSGAGKSTLLRLLLLLDRPTGGEIRVNGESTRQIRPRSLPRYRRRFGVVFQDHRLLFDRNVHENVALPLVMAGFSPRDTARRVRAALDKVGLLANEYASPESLSGGEQQRVGIARAVVARPEFLIADEPTGNLDPQLSAEIMALFEAFNQVGVTVLVATHDLPLISRFRHRIITLTSGRLAGAGTT
ncbi:MAG: cell division ATP-binding protein FtsE [Luminiphilus sp.]|nr:cell division ATP-binding protein FtsE [Luminiphilus sp.]